MYTFLLTYDDIHLNSKNCVENKEQKDYLQLIEIQKQEIRIFQYTIYVQFFTTILRYETLNS